MSAIKLHVIKPSVNNMTARVFVRAAKLDFTEDDVYGKTRSEEFSARNPSHLTPMMEAAGLPKGVVWESCAIMQYLCNKHHLDTFYPTDPENGRWSTARCSISSARSIPISPARPIGRSGFRNIPARSAPATPTRPPRTRRRKRRSRRSARRWKCSRKFYLDGKTFIGGDHPSIADIRLSSSLEFLKAIDYLPDWVKTYMAAVAKALGDAYAEPAKDVEGISPM